MLTFRLNGEIATPGSDVAPTTTVLDWLRGQAGLSGTKEGCAEGDCGACTVVLEGDDCHRAPVNACLLTLGQTAGRRLWTVEGLRDVGGTPHPIQTLMAEGHGTQCGFCTPGIVMSGWAYATEGGDVHEALAGNLCRCTGYRPIVEAFERVPREAAESAVATQPERQPEIPRVFVGGGQNFHRPRALAELLALRAEFPEAWLLAGGTDLGLRFSEHRERPERVICTLGVAELGGVAVEAAGLRIGSAVPFARVLDVCAAEAGFGAFAELLRRLGSRQIRSLGTLGGNLGTASPIGDALPPLVAYGARVRLASCAAERELPVEAFLTGYRTSELRADEIIRDIFIPRPAANALVACEKISRRTDQDIAAAGLSVVLERSGDRIAAVRIAHGGLGPKVDRASVAEAVLTGARFERGAFDRAAEALAQNIAPRSDLRAGARYRGLVAANLMRRLWWKWSREAAP